MGKELKPFVGKTCQYLSNVKSAIIVCDDGSSDRTLEVVSAFQDSRIIYLRHPQNLGRSLNMRSGFTATQREYFIKFDDDDRLTPEFLAKTIPILDQEKNVDCACTDHWIIVNKAGLLLSLKQLSYLVR